MTPKVARLFYSSPALRFYQIAYSLRSKHFLMWLATCGQWWYLKLLEKHLEFVILVMEFLPPFSLAWFLTQHSRLQSTSQAESWIHKLLYILKFRPGHPAPKGTDPIQKETKGKAGITKRVKKNRQVSIK